jgi:phosphomannomutase
MGRINSFKAYDIRGVYGSDFTDEHAYLAGYYLPELLQTDKVLVGRDARLSSASIYENLCRGICDAGADVYSLGLTTTPMVYYFTAKEGFKASVQITASHNPARYNGLKISTTDAAPVGYDNGLNQLEQLILNHKEISDKPGGRIFLLDKKQEYLNFFKQYLCDISELNIAIDCSNGMAGLFIRELLGDSPLYLFEEPDGRFPNHEPNPLEPENLLHLQDAVRERQCDLGIIFDGDADRVMFVDEKSNFIPPDLIIAFLSDYFKEERGETGMVIQDIRSSKSVGEFLCPLGFEMHTWKVGRAFAAPRLKEINGLYGGELAGHYYFRDFYYSDSGFLACLLVLRILLRYKRHDISMSQAISAISRYANSGEINFRLERKDEAMEAVRAYFMDQNPCIFMDFDGYRLEFEDFWINIRPSNTEPYLRFIAEANSPEILETIVAKTREIIRQFE